jgi:ankyrin repeat protein
MLKFLIHKLHIHCIDSDLEEVQNILLERRSELSVDHLNDCFIRSVRVARDCDKHIEIVRLLLEHGANINHIQEGNITKYSPLQWAIFYQKQKLAEDLILQGADLNHTAYTSYGSVTAFDMLSYYLANIKYKHLYYLMLLHGATLRKEIMDNVLKFYFRNWETEMLVYCLERKELPYLIFALELN